MKRERMSITLNPVPEFIDDEQDLTNYHTSFFHSLLMLLGKMESHLAHEDDAVPTDFNNQLQFLMICNINKLVSINKRVQKHTAAGLKKGYLFNEVVRV